MGWEFFHGLKSRKDFQRGDCILCLFNNNVLILGCRDGGRKCEEFSDDSRNSVRDLKQLNALSIRRNQEVR
jgi:hypothetical protein